MLKINKSNLPHRRGEAGGAMIAYLIFALIIMATIAALGAYVIQNVNYGRWRLEMVNAYQYAQGGAAMACQNIESAFLTGGSILTNLTASTNGGWSKNTSKSSATELVFERTIAAPFTNQTVAVELWMTNSVNPPSIKVYSTATVGKSTQRVQANLDLKFAYGAAIISTGQGDYSTSVSKSCAQGGNVVVAGNNPNVTKVDGGILSNGAVNTNDCVIDSISKNLYGTANQIPDYTSPGSSYQLFDFNRFIAVADASSNHFPNLIAFVGQAKTKTLEGVVVVDIKYGSSLPDLDTKTLPSGINVRGTLVFNFTPNSKGKNWDPLDKIVNTATMNINAANLSGLNPNDPSTYTTGYPPTYTDPSKNPVNVDITAYGFENFTEADDLPALMYNNAILDMHGNINICGVVYSSSFMEIENKRDDQIQYFRGALIGGGGIYLENGKDAKTIVSYDPQALDVLATAGTRGKTAKLVYMK
jgi:hypothetical protein